MNNLTNTAILGAPTASYAARIAIDLTPLLPGGLNGGAKVMALRLIQQLAALAPHYQFILIGPENHYNELLRKNYNITYLSLAKSSKHLATVPGDTPSAAHNKPLIKPLLMQHLFPFPTLKKVIKRFISHYTNYFISQKIKRLAQPDLLFCPFTAPSLQALNVPIVAIVHDLQFVDYPYFFSDAERYERKLHFKAVTKRADQLVCVSDFTRKTVLANSTFPPEKVKTIHTQQAYCLPSVEPPHIAATLKRLQLAENNFLLYPANFWPHKNHEMLITAFNLYHAQYPDTTLKLVCTGADHPRKHQLMKAVQTLQLADRILFPGYLSEVELAHLLHSSLAVIFPSLYEGFGMPVLEAMAVGKPVLCSHVTSLPEIAGQAALFFDPRKPSDIAKAIYRIHHDSQLANEFSRLGLQQVARFGSERDMATAYLHVFEETLNAHRTRFRRPQ